MRRGDYAETRAVTELSAAQGPGPTYLLDITACHSTRAPHARPELQRGAEMTGYFRSEPTFDIDMEEISHAATVWPSFNTVSSSLFAVSLIPVCTNHGAVKREEEKPR